MSFSSYATNLARGKENPSLFPVNSAVRHRTVTHGPLGALDPSLGEV
jgi:hypothetical protein